MNQFTCLDGTGKERERGLNTQREHGRVCVHYHTGLTLNGAPGPVPTRRYTLLSADECVSLQRDAVVLVFVPSLSTGSHGGGRHQQEPASDRRRGRGGGQFTGDSDDDEVDVAPATSSSSRWKWTGELFTGCSHSSE